MVADPHYFHAVRFYKDSAGLCRMVGSFLAEGFERDQPAVVIATLPHTAAICRHLSESGYDTSALQQSGRLFTFDAQETLERFMVNGMPDMQLFRDAMLPVLEQASGTDKDDGLRAYGEMVDVLWKSQQASAAMRLELFWNTLVSTYSITLLCGYALTHFYNSAAVNGICSLHSHVINERGFATPAH
jgi:hypothetical protein